MSWILDVCSRSFNVTLHTAHCNLLGPHFCSNKLFSPLTVLSRDNSLPATHSSQLTAHSIQGHLSAKYEQNVSLYSVTLYSVPREGCTADSLGQRQSHSHSPSSYILPASNDALVSSCVFPSPFPLSQLSDCVCKLLVRHAHLSLTHSCLSCSSRHLHWQTRETKDKMHQVTDKGTWRRCKRMLPGCIVASGEDAVAKERKRRPRRVCLLEQGTINFAPAAN